MWKRAFCSNSLHIFAQNLHLSSCWRTITIRLSWRITWFQQVSVDFCLFRTFRSFQLHQRKTAVFFGNWLVLLQWSCDWSLKEFFFGKLQFVWHSVTFWSEFPKTNANTRRIASAMQTSSWMKECTLLDLLSEIDERKEWFKWDKPLDDMFCLKRQQRWF